MGLMTSGNLTKLIENISYDNEIPRDYIGASAIGSDCLRQTWYELNGYKEEKVGHKIKRTWNLGKYLERWIIDLVRKSGLHVETPCEDNNWLEFCDPDFPWFKGHCDALIIHKQLISSPIAILEIKTAKNSSFNLFKSNGIKAWDMRYYDQVQSYMGFSNIEQAYILVLNKDNTELWDEVVIFDEIYYDEQIKQKAKMIHDYEIPPPRVNNSPFWFQCKMCKYRKECHG